MKKAFWILALGAIASAIMAASIGQAEDTPANKQASQGKPAPDAPSTDAPQEPGN